MNCGLLERLLLLKANSIESHLVDAFIFIDHDIFIS